MFTFDGKVIHVDPFSKLAEYSKLPKADMLLITHEHGDHLDLKTVEAVRTDKTVLVLTKTCAARLKGGIIMVNGDTETVAGLKIETVPAYNLVHMRSEGVPFHPKGIGASYQHPACPCARIFNYFNVVLFSKFLTMMTNSNKYTG